MPSSLFTEKVGLAIVGASRAEFGPTSMTKPVVVMAVPISPNFEAALAEKFNLLRLWQAEDKEEFLAKNANEIRGMVVIPAFAINKDVLCQLPKLEIVSTVSIGLDKIDLEACRERGIAVTNTPDVLTDEVADLAIALVLTTMRRICAADGYVRQGLWPIKGDFPLTHKVSGKRMGILGLGRIGSAIAKRAESFGCSISYYSRAKKPVAYTHYESVAELAKNSDILVVACALTDGTFHLVNREVLDALGANGTLVNIARGAIVDEAELVSALLEGRLGAAGLDVFENEPHVPEALFGLENVVLLPHAGSATLETRSAMAGLVLGNLEAHFAGKPLLTPVN